MLGLQTYFNYAAHNGGITQELREQIFAYLSNKYSCVSLRGSCYGKDAKASAQKGWPEGSTTRIYPRTDYKTDMMGISTGFFNKLIVLDIDNVPVFNEFAEDYNLALPETFTVQTGRGYHYYFVYPDNSNKYDSKDYPLAGFEIKGMRRYVVVPGSNHPNGSLYTPINWHEIVVMPEWMFSLYDPNSYISKILEKIKILCKPDDITNYSVLKQKIEGFLPVENQPIIQIPVTPFENLSEDSVILNTETQNLLNQSPPVKHRSEPIMSGINTLLNADFTAEQTKQIMLNSPLGDKLVQKGEQFTNREINSGIEFIQANPPKKQKINIEDETYKIMLQQYYVQDSEGRLYCKVIQSNARIEYIDVKSDSFYGIICKQLLSRFKRSIIPTKFKPLLTVLIEEKRLTAPIVPTVNRFYQDDKRLIYDLGRDDYQCVEISSSGFKIIPHPEMILERSVLTLPVQDIDISPETIDNVNSFWDLCGIYSDYQRHYLNIIILSYLFDKISTPIVYFYGHYGSGKTHLARSIKGIFDPWEAGGVIPTKIDNFRLLLNQSGIGFMDNFSELKRDILNDLCNSYTGGIAYSRQLFQDKKAIKYNIKCPMILASINVPTKLPDDFVSRTVFIRVNPKHKRLPEMELNQKLNNLYPMIRGEMFNLASQVLPLLNTYKPTNLSRHADLDLLGQAYCDICKTPLSYIDICQQINIDSAFSVIEDEPSIRNFIRVVSERKFITFTMSEMSEIMFKDLNLDFRIDEAKLGRDLKIYAMVLHQLHIKLYYGEKLSSGAKPCVAFFDDGNSIPEDVDTGKLNSSPQYVTEIYLRSHKTEISQVLDEMINND